MPPRTVVLCAVPLVLAAFVGIVVIDGEFVYDDPSALVESPIVTGEVPVWQAFERDFWGRSARQGFTTWRPLMPILWAQLWALWPNDPLPFRILGVLLHVLAVAFAVIFVFRLRRSVAWAAAAGTLFAVHPLNTEAVSAIVAQADLLSFSCVLLACIAALRPPGLAPGLWSAVALLIGTLVKESAVIFTPLIALLFLLERREPRARILAAAPPVLLGIAVVAFQLGLPRGPGISMVTSNVAHQAHGFTRLLLGFYNVGRSLTMTVWPHPLAPNHGFAAVELQLGALLPFALVGAALLLTGVAVGVWAIRRRRLDWVSALCFLYAPAVLQSHWFVRLITDLAERLLYPATLGISMLVTIAVFHFVGNPTIRAAVITGASLVFLVGGFQPRRAWTTEDALWTYAVQAEARAAIHHHNVSNTFFKAGDLERGAFHRLLYTYLIFGFPEPVPWAALRETADLSLTERFTVLPAVLYPEDPCPLIRTFLGKATRYEPLHAYAVERWSSRYPACGPWPED